MKLFKDNFVEHYPSRIVNSVYFIDPIYSELHRYETDSFEKEKVRFRWYGDSADDALKNKLMKLELKQKSGLIGKKIQLPVFNFTQTIFDFSHETLIKLFKNSLDPKDRLRLSSYYPISFVSYFRNYFINTASGMRVTIDSNICYSLVGSTLKGAKIKDKSDVLEIKSESDGIQGTRRYTFLDGVGLTQMKFSKFHNSLSSFGIVTE